MTLADILFEIALHNGRYSHPLSLVSKQTKVYSENGEDGIIAEIFNRIGPGGSFFVEIGSGRGLVNNTRFLLEQGWRGIWIDGQEKEVALARQRFGRFVEEGVLCIHHAMLTAQNVDAVLDQAGAPSHFDFLSLDIDQNTGHVWKAIQRQCRAACIEYNASLPPNVALQANYVSELSWDSHFTNWFGASLKALETIGHDKGMSLVGCESAGVNAFFVDSTQADKFHGPFTAEAHYEPPRYGLVPNWGHAASGEARKWVR
jgi:hypothetical protein